MFSSRFERRHELEALAGDEARAEQLERPIVAGRRAQRAP